MTQGTAKRDDLRLAGGLDDDRRRPGAGTGRFRCQSTLPVAPSKRIELGQVLLGFALVELHDQRPCQVISEEAWPYGFFGIAEVLGPAGLPSRVNAARSPLAKMA